MWKAFLHVNVERKYRIGYSERAWAMRWWMLFHVIYLFASFMSCSYACYVWKTLVEAPDCFCIKISSHKWALSGHFSTQFWEPMIVLWALAGNFPTIWNGHYCCLNSKLHQGQWVQWHVIMVKSSVQVSMYMLELIIFYRQWIAHVNYTYFMMDSCVMEPWGDN